MYMKTMTHSFCDKVTDAGISALSAGCGQLQSIILWGCDEVTDVLIWLKPTMNFRGRGSHNCISLHHIN